MNIYEHPYTLVHLQQDVIPEAKGFQERLEQLR